MRTAAAPGQPVGTLPDGTAFFAPLGQLIRDGDERVVCHLCGRHMKMLGGNAARPVPPLLQSRARRPLGA
ncbi:MAG: hypothetical protein JO262_13060 [Solirubrobacterales bacterium]|nr:hypothetical protein [Solirubrobacterales bacterium]